MRIESQPKREGVPPDLIPHALLPQRLCHLLTLRLPTLVCACERAHSAEGVAVMHALMVLWAACSHALATACVPPRAKTVLGTVCVGGGGASVVLCAHVSVRACALVWSGLGVVALRGGRLGKGAFVPSLALRTLSARFSFPTFSNSMHRFSYGAKPATCGRGQRRCGVAAVSASPEAGPLPFRARAQQAATIAAHLPDDRAHKRNALVQLLRTAGTRG